MHDLIIWRVLLSQKKLTRQARRHVTDLTIVKATISTHFPVNLVLCTTFSSLNYHQIGIC
jgi:hypothetical protein